MNRISVRVFQVFAVTVLTLLFSTGNARAMPAQMPLVLGEDECYGLSGYVEYLRDPSGKLIIDDVAGTQWSSEFQPVPAGGLNLGFTEDAVWLRFSIDATLATEKQWLLIIRYPLLDHARIVIRQRSGGERTFYAGDRIPFSARPVKHRFFIFPIANIDGEIIDVYARVQTRGTMRVPLEICSNAHFIMETERNAYLLGAVLGIILLMVVMSLFLSYTFGDRSYVWFVLFLLSYLIFVSLQNGTFIELLEPDKFSLKMHWYIISASIGMAALSMFSRFFLQTPERSLVAELLLRSIIVVALLHALLLPFLPIGTLLLSVSFVALTWTVIHIIVGFIILLQGFSPARYYLSAWVIYLAGIALFALRGMGVLPNNAITIYSSEAGFLLMAVMLTMGMSHRIRMMEEEREEAVHESLAHMEELNRLKSDTVMQLESAHKVKDDFIMSSSYKLRAPLQRISGFIETILHRWGGSGEDREDLEYILLSARHLSSIVNDIHDYTLLKNNEITLNYSTVDMYALVSEVLRRAEFLRAGKSVALENRVPHGLMVHADEIRMSQILYHLVSNGIRFSENGAVVVSADVLPGEAHEIIEITVSDEGQGLDPANMPLLFEPFQGSSSDEQGGSGIGLNLSKGLVELHGGHIDVDSEPGQGSLFTVRIPSRQVDGSTIRKILEHRPVSTTDPRDYSTQESQPDERRRSKGTVVLVDSDLINLKLLDNYLNDTGFQVYKFIDSTTVLPHLEEHPLPEVVLVNQYMPRIDGVELTRRLREKYTSSELPILLLTRKTRGDEVSSLLQSGASDYITLPVSRDELVSRIRTQVRLKRSAREKERLRSLDKEISIAAHIQSSSLPQSVPQVPELDIAPRYIPMEGIGGDFYYFHQISESRIGFFISDVSGHGVSAALIASMVKLASIVLKDVAGEPARFLEEMNRLLYRNIEERFLTASYLLLDLEQKEIRYARAGHDPLVYCNRYERTVKYLQPPGSLIGVKERTGTEEQVMPLRPGDRFLLYTDGITETRNAQGEMYGDRAFDEFIRRSLSTNAEGMLADLVKELRGWNGGSAYDDDITCVLIDYNGD